jgi:hypothetical protein
VIYLRIYALDAARNKRLINTVRFGEWGSLALWFNNVGQAGDRRGFAYEVEEYAGTPGDPDGE